MINLNNYIPDKRYSNGIPYPFLGVFLWFADKEIIPIIIPSAKNLILGMGVSPNYEVTNLPSGLKFDMIKRVIYGTPRFPYTETLSTYSGLSDILIKSMTGEVEETYCFAWIVKGSLEVSCFIEFENTYHVQT